MIKCSSGHKGGGVLILVKSTFISQAKPEYNTNVEFLWVQHNLLGSKSAYKCNFGNSGYAF